LEHSFAKIEYYDVRKTIMMSGRRWFGSYQLDCVGVLGQAGNA